MYLARLEMYLQGKCAIAWLPQEAIGSDKLLRWNGHNLNCRPCQGVAANINVFTELSGSGTAWCARAADG
jgi:hypothetical protein